MTFARSQFNSTHLVLSLPLSTIDSSLFFVCIPTIFISLASFLLSRLVSLMIIPWFSPYVGRWRAKERRRDVKSNVNSNECILLKRDSVSMWTSRREKRANQTAKKWKDERKKEMGRKHLKKKMKQRRRERKRAVFHQHFFFLHLVRLSMFNDS